MAGHYDPAQPRDHHGEWTSGAEAVARNITGKGRPKAAKKAEPDLSTPEARRAAVASADLSTPAGRALVRKAQRASEQSVAKSLSFMPGSAVPATPRPARRKGGS